MLVAIIIILSILWILGYAPLSGISLPNIVLITINNHPVTLWEILTLAVISWAIGILPRTFQIVASVLLIFWILSVLGVFAIGGLPGIVVLIVIITLIVSIFV